MPPCHSSVGSSASISKFSWLPDTNRVVKDFASGRMQALEKDENRQAMRASRQREMEEWLDRQELRFTEYEDSITRTPAFTSARMAPYSFRASTMALWSLPSSSVGDSWQ